MHSITVRLLATSGILIAAGRIAANEPAGGAVERALAFLAREVPQWSVQNKCYSCHNNGDAARALYAAKRKGFEIAPEALADTTDWLSRPEAWKDNGGDGVQNDRKLAAIQFSFSLVAAMESGSVRDPQPLARAAELVAGHQDADGSWKIDADGNIGSPATYGNVLATAVSLQILSNADGERFRPRIDKAASWLATRETTTVLDAAATLIGLAARDGAAPAGQRAKCLELIRKGESRSGGWGPYILSAAEPFDTAVVLLALTKLPPDDQRRAMIERGRRYLRNSQLDDGSWPETTRPARAESYAQRLSTAGWATLALLATQAK